MKFKYLLTVPGVLVGVSLVACALVIRRCFKHKG